jgi:hypothetical protein
MMTIAFVESDNCCRGFNFSEDMPIRNWWIHQSQNKKPVGQASAPAIEKMDDPPPPP